MLRGSSCQGPERYFDIIIFFRILEFGVDYSAADSGADRSADPNRFPPTRKPMQPTAATVFQNRSTTQIPGVHHDPDIVVRNPAHRRGSKAAVCLTIGGHPIDPASNSSREWRVLAERSSGRRLDRGKRQGVDDVVNSAARNKAIAGGSELKRLEL